MSCRLKRGRQNWTFFRKILNYFFDWNRKFLRPDSRPRPQTSNQIDTAALKRSSKLNLSFIIIRTKQKPQSSLFVWQFSQIQKISSTFSALYPIGSDPVCSSNVTQSTSMLQSGDVVQLSCTIVYGAMRDPTYVSHQTA